MLSRSLAPMRLGQEGADRTSRCTCAIKHAIDSSPHDHTSPRPTVPLCCPSHITLNGALLPLNAGIPSRPSPAALFYLLPHARHRPRTPNPPATLHLVGHSARSRVQTPAATKPLPLFPAAPARLVCSLCLYWTNSTTPHHSAPPF
jgi:hypothetical protein